MHLTPEMWRMLPVFWVLGLLTIGARWRVIGKTVQAAQDEEAANP